MKLIRQIALLFALLAFAGTACAVEKVSRPASKKDIVGTWELASVRPVHDSKDPVFYPYQRFVFKENSTMKFMASERPFTKEWLDKFEKQPAEIDFLVDEKGAMTLMWQKQPHRENVISAFVLKDIPADVLAKLPPERRKGLPKKGDLTLSFLNSKGKIAYQKVLTLVR